MHDDARTRDCGATDRHVHHDGSLELHALHGPGLEPSSEEDLRVGLGFFGASQFGGDDVVDCDIANYATPKVEIDRVASNGQSLLAAIIANQPGGLTPTLPALQGALKHAETWVAEGKAQGRSVVVVLITDGYPTQCQSPVSIAEIAAVAKAGHDDYQIRTFVIGLAAGFNLDSIAQAGNSDAAILLDEAQPASTLVEALGRISHPDPCEFHVPIPPPGFEIEFEPNKVALFFTPAAGAEQEIPSVENEAGCDASSNGGWYYDNIGNPKRILVCPCTCASVSAPGRARVTYGCAPTSSLR